MPAKVIIAKNTTGSPVTISGIDVTIAGGGSFALSDFFRLDEIWECADLATKIGAGSIIINDGVSDLNSAQSLQYVTPVMFPDSPMPSWKWPVRVATTASITLSGTQTIDGVALSVDDRVLVKNQGTASSNGLYFVKSGAWVRTPDFDENSEINSGSMVVVAAGSTQSGKMYRLSSADPITLGSSSITWTEFSGGGGSGDVVGPAGATTNEIPLFADTTGKLLKNSALVSNGATTRTFGITLSGSPITTGAKGCGIRVPFTGTITKWTLLADVSGNVVIDIWKTTFASAPPTVLNTITASAKPTLSSQQKAESSTLTGWTTSVSAGDVIIFAVDSVATISSLSVFVEVTITS